ncbi:MAG: M48 family metalloprotease [Kiritimatiellae bacterium]|nr:M48 family metalloprotease [Kiritimatiellia bacterium]
MLGFPLLVAFGERGLRGVLAHELGHIAHSDTVHFGTSTYSGAPSSSASLPGPWGPGAAPICAVSTAWCLRWRANANSRPTARLRSSTARRRCARCWSR